MVNDEQEATRNNSVVKEFHQDVFCEVVSTRFQPQITCASRVLYGLINLPDVIQSNRVASVKLNTLTGRQFKQAFVFIF